MMQIARLEAGHLRVCLGACLEGSDVESSPMNVLADHHQRVSPLIHHAPATITPTRPPDSIRVPGPSSGDRLLPYHLGVRRKRAGFVVGGLAAVSVGIAVAIMPFRFMIGRGEYAIRAKGGAPIVIAWSREPRGAVAVWAASNGSENWREVRFGGEPYAAHEGRKRLAVAAGLVGLGATAAVRLGRRPRRRTIAMWTSPSTVQGR